MAQGIIRGLLAEGNVAPQDIYVTASTQARTQTAATALGVSASDNNANLVRAVDILILAVKPTVLPAVLAELTEALDATRPLLVSIASGLTLADLASHVPLAAQDRIFRAMPNINVTIRQGVTAICGAPTSREQDLALVEDLFQAVGSSYRLAEKDFRNFTALAGCSPAFTYLYIDAMSRAGVKNGLPKTVATQIATEAVFGSAKMLLEHPQETPWDLIDKVCSPGGTTVAGLVALEEEKFIATVIKGLDATIQRDQEIAQEK